MSSAFLITISEIRSSVGDIPSQLYTTDIGQEGHWYFDGIGVLAEDNTGTILITADLKRFKRVFEGALNVKWFGAKGDYDSLTNIGTDDTLAVQKALDAGGVINVPKGTYKINPIDPNYPNSFFNGGLKMKNHSSLYFLDGAILTMAPTDKIAYTLINLTNTTNVSIYNANIIGDVDSHIGSTGEDGYGIYIQDAINPRLYNCIVSKCWGDGYYFGSNGLGVLGGLLSNCIADDNRRQGLSIVSWVHGLVIGGEFKNTGKTKLTAPGFGIDIEPNGKGYDQIDVTLLGIRTSSNARGGLQIVPGLLTTDSYVRPIFNVKVLGYDSLGDGNSGALRFSYPPLDAVGVRPNERIYGKILTQGVTIRNSVGRSVDFSRWVPGSPEVQIDDLTIINANESGSTATNEQQCGVVIYIDPAQANLQSSTGKITLNNLTVIDTREEPKMLVPIWANCGPGQSIDDLVINDLYSSGQKSISNGFTVITRTKRSKLKYNIAPIKDFNSSLVLFSGSYAGYSLAASVSNVFTLPLAEISVGLEYKFENRYGVALSIKTNSADQILNYTAIGSNGLVLRDINDSITLRSVGPNTWEVVHKSGKIAPIGFLSGFLSKGIVLYANSAPTTGTWSVADEVSNYTPSNSSVKGWICVAAGNPGTWIPYGVINTNLEKNTIGTTAQRPINITIGYEYFDTTIGKPIWWKGAVWVDAMGTTV